MMPHAADAAGCELGSKRVAAGIKLPAVTVQAGVLERYARTMPSIHSCLPLTNAQPAQC